MARILNYTDEQFWDMTPRKLIAMIEKWKAIENAKIQAAQPSLPASTEDGVIDVDGRFF
jgi:hypothetical protein